MSQDTSKMLERAQEQLAAIASSLETLMMDLVTSRLQFIDQWFIDPFESPSTVMEQVQELHRELQIFKEDLDKVDGEASM